MANVCFTSALFSAFLDKAYSMILIQLWACVIDAMQKMTHMSPVNYDPQSTN